MKPQDFEEYLNNIEFDDKPDYTHRDKLEKELLKHFSEQSRHKTSVIWILNNRIFKYAAAAVLIFGVLLGINFLGTPIDGASTAFAAAMDSIKKARTFSCIEYYEKQFVDGWPQGEYEMKYQWMFKEPNFMRRDILESPRAGQAGQVDIWDYSNGESQHLECLPHIMTAVFSSSRSRYTIDNKTGEVKLTQYELNTNIRDKLLDVSMGTLDDLGYVEFDGKTVLKCQTQKNGRLTTIWIDPKTTYPVQIEHTWPEQKRSPILYTSIKIDEEIDDKYFSFEPPEGYTVNVSRPLPGYSDERLKMRAKILHLFTLLGMFPKANELDDLVKEGKVSENVLNRLLAPLDDPDGPPVIKYRKPDMNEPWETEIELYEDYEDGTVDGRVLVYQPLPTCNLVPIQTVKQLLKPWPTDKKKLAKNITTLHWWCERYAVAHEGNYPEKLEDIVGSKVWEELLGKIYSEESLKYLQTNGQPDGPDVIQYRPPSPDLEVSNQIMFYQIYETWPEDGAMVCYGDGDCEIIKDQDVFEELIK